MRRSVRGLPGAVSIARDSKTQLTVNIRKEKIRMRLWFSMIVVLVLPSGHGVRALLARPCQPVHVRHRLAQERKQIQRPEKLHSLPADAFGE